MSNKRKRGNRKNKENKENEKKDVNVNEWARVYDGKVGIGEMFTQEEGMAADELLEELGKGGSGVGGSGRGCGFVYRGKVSGIFGLFRS